MPGATLTHGLPYPLGSDPINIASDIQALAEAVDVDLAAQSVLAPGQAGVFAFKYYATGMLFDASGIGRFDWAPVVPVSIKAVWIESNSTHTAPLRLWGGVVGVGFNQTSVWCQGGPPNATIAFVELLVLDKVA
jgi:hypothetical protein